MRVILPVLSTFKMLNTVNLERIHPPAPIVSDDYPYYEEVRNAYFVPEYRAAYKHDGCLIESSVLVRGPKGFRKAFPAPSNLSLNLLHTHSPIIDNAIYAGYIFSHYGHFLTESLARLWPLLLKERILESGIDFPVKLLFSIGTEMPLCEANTALLRGLQEIFDCRVLLMDDPTYVGHLLVPELAMVHNWKLYKVFASLAAELGRAVVKTGNSSMPNGMGRFIYLSRRKLDPIVRNILNEHELERELHNEGFTIVHPEKLTLADQIRTLNAAEVVVGSIGSSFHTMLLSEVRGKTFVYFAHGEVNRNFVNIDAVTGARSHYVHCLHPFNMSLKRSTMRDVYYDIGRAKDAVREICRKGRRH